MGKQMVKYDENFRKSVRPIYPQYFECPILFYLQ